MARGTTRTLPVDMCPNASRRSPTSPAEKAGGSWRTGAAPASVVPLPPPIPLLGFLMRTGEVGEGGRETWRGAVENVGGGGVCWIEGCESSGVESRVVGEVNRCGWGGVVDDAFSRTKVLWAFFIP